MSGELRDPAKSLPRGTLAAVGLSMVIFLGAALPFAGSLPGSELVADYGAMSRVALVPGLITAGIFAATLSSLSPPSWARRASCTPWRVIACFAS